MGNKNKNKLSKKLTIFGVSAFLAVSPAIMISCQKENQDYKENSLDYKTQALNSSLNFTNSNRFYSDEVEKHIKSQPSEFYEYEFAKNEYEKLLNKINQSNKVLKKEYETFSKAIDKYRKEIFNAYYKCKTLEIKNNSEEDKYKKAQKDILHAIKTEVEFLLKSKASEYQKYIKTEYDRYLEFLNESKKNIKNGITLPSDYEKTINNLKSSLKILDQKLQEIKTSLNESQLNQIEKLIDYMSNDYSKKYVDEWRLSFLFSSCLDEANKLKEKLMKNGSMNQNFFEMSKNEIEKNYLDIENILLKQKYDEYIQHLSYTPVKLIENKLDFIKKNITNLNLFYSPTLKKVILTNTNKPSEEDLNNEDLAILELTNNDIPRFSNLISPDSLLADGHLNNELKTIIQNDKLIIIFRIGFFNPKLKRKIVGGKTYYYEIFLTDESKLRNEAIRRIKYRKGKVDGLEWKLNSWDAQKYARENYIDFRNSYYVLRNKILKDEAIDFEGELNALKIKFTEINEAIKVAKAAEEKASQKAKRIQDRKEKLNTLLAKVNEAEAKQYANEKYSDFKSAYDNLLSQVEADSANQFDEEFSTLETKVSELNEAIQVAKAAEEKASQKAKRIQDKKDKLNTLLAKVNEAEAKQYANEKYSDFKSAYDNLLSQVEADSANQFEEEFSTLETKVSELNEAIKTAKDTEAAQKAKRIQDRKEKLNTLLAKVNEAEAKQYANEKYSDFKIAYDNLLSQVEADSANEFDQEFSTLETKVSELNEAIKTAKDTEAAQKAKRIQDRKEKLNTLLAKVNEAEAKQYANEKYSDFKIAYDNLLSQVEADSANEFDQEFSTLETKVSELNEAIKTAKDTEA
ncbi:hypothetical protein, partial [Metamycoplasma neophronis]